MMAFDAMRLDVRAGKLLLFACLALALCGALHLPTQLAAPPPDAATVIELRLGDLIEPMAAEYVTGALRNAKNSGASLVLITMDTPGGFDDAMREIIQGIVHCEVPVVVYVYPSGSRAASAGFFILLSADVAAMAPGTDTGAASPILISMLSGSTVKIDDTLKNKIINEATAYLRGIAQKRGRNVELAEKAVTEAKAFSDKEALDGKLVDLVASTPDDLLAKLNGRTVQRFDGTEVTLKLENPVRRVIDLTGRQKFLSHILRPDVMFILLLVGILGLYVEFTHPGLIFPGVIGGIALLLALYGMRVLPVNAAGVLLIVLAVALFILEAKYTSHGVLGLGGGVAMIIGALLLIDSPITGMRVSLGVALGVTVPFALIVVFLMRLVLQSMRWRPAMGAHAMVGEVGEVTEAIDRRGMVFVAGELWRAAAAAPIAKGARVRVTSVDGLTVHVEPVAEVPPVQQVKEA